MDAIVIGAGVIGAACALALSDAGLKVLVIDRSTIASGTTGAGEGNILVSDKGPGPELVLARRSRDAWFEIANRIGNTFELEAKGGLVISRSDAGIAKLRDFAELQRTSGVETTEVGSRELRELEPYLAPDISFGIHYPQDGQCQPMLAAASMLRVVRNSGGIVRERESVLAISRTGNELVVRTSEGIYIAPVVVNATGTWAGEVARLAGSDLPIAPRRGFILVTAPAPELVRRKVYDADYVANVASGEADLSSSAVVESTKSGTILIGASRERVGFDSSLDVEILRRLARQAISLFPLLAKVDLLRAYTGFRPYAPDHLPVIGEDARIPGLYHAAGHEGAGIGLAPATAELIRAAVMKETAFMDPSPFSPTRFAGAS
ncbi:hydrogen cyanide synthase subunit HcnC precursor [mine drainage metagenome]|uniref:Hydrogen cyanide synthase subunit HcnC n=1 Tax=mine drainage metagenome TaxID=410659 RepID=A0A1J5QQP9_9ZZZZ